MRTLKAIFAAALLAALLAPLSAAAQQTADSQPSAQSAAPDATQMAQPSQPTAPSTAAPVETTASQPAAAPAPTTMDQVVTLFIEREHSLIKMLSTRTPIVETYLQNLTADPQLGSVPSADHYFLGRMDMGETGRAQGLSEGRRQGHAGPLDGWLPETLQGTVSAPGLLVDGLCRPH